MQQKRWELLSATARLARLHATLLTFGALADVGRDDQDLGSRVDTYPTSLGEWLARAVQIGASAVWQAPSIPLLLMAPDDRGYPRPAIGRESTRRQGAQSVLSFGAALWSALLELRSAWADDELQHRLVEAIADEAFDMLDEVREETDGFSNALRGAADAVWTFTVYVQRGATAPPDAIADMLAGALAWLAAAVACTDTIAFSGLDDVVSQ
jgi:hypothetical protein